MTMIHVPRPPKNSLNLNRPVSSLVLAQVEHMHTAEKRLPLRYRTEIYINAIKTEGEAARYISKVTSAIHRAHDDAAKQRTKRAPIRKAAPYGGWRGEACGEAHSQTHGEEGPRDGFRAKKQLK